MNLQSFISFSDLLHCAVAICSEKDLKHCSTNLQPCFLWYFTLSEIVYCATRNKVPHNLCMRPVKHFNIIQGKILLLFQMLNK